MSDVIGISFPGVDFPLAASYTLGHGISPSIATLEMVPQYGESQVQQSGDLVLSLGENYITAKDCKIDSASTRYSSTGARTIVLRILDRRWKWKFGIIGGRYNVRRPDGSIDPDTEQSPQQLATKLFQAMGETGFQVGDLPDETRPEVDWDADSPSQELDTLCGSLGCRVVLHLDGTAAIRRTGVGSQLPGGPQISESIGINPPDKPSSLTFVSGPVRFQQSLELEAVGEDTDGSIKLINQLSYAPQSGWENESPHEPILSDTNDKNRAAAKKTVFRWYRIKDSISAPGYPNINRLQDILPVDDFLVDTKTDNTGKKIPLKAYVYGEHWDRFPGKTANANGTQVHVSFSLDKERGIVQFSDFVVKLDASSGKVHPAEIKLHCSYEARNSNASSEPGNPIREVVRWKKTVSINSDGSSTETEIVRNDETLPTVRETYNGSGAVTGYVDNFSSDVEPAADHYLQAALDAYQGVETDEREYPGILPIDPDGAIQQVGWTVRTGTNGGAFTTASRNSEYSLAVPTYKESKRIAAAQEALKLAKQQQVKSRRSPGGGFGSGGP